MVTWRSPRKSPAAVAGTAFQRVGVAVAAVEVPIENRYSRASTSLPDGDFPVPAVRGTMVAADFQVSQPIPGVH